MINLKIQLRLYIPDTVRSTTSSWISFLLLPHIASQTTSHNLFQDMKSFKLINTLFSNFLSRIQVNIQKRRHQLLLSKNSLRDETLDWEVSPLFWWKASHQQTDGRKKLRQQYFVLYFNNNQTAQLNCAIKLRNQVEEERKEKNRDGKNLDSLPPTPSIIDTRKEENIKENEEEKILLPRTCARKKFRFKSKWRKFEQKWRMVSKL